MIKFLNIAMQQIQILVEGVRTWGQSLFAQLLHSYSANV